MFKCVSQLWAYLCERCGVTVGVGPGCPCVLCRDAVKLDIAQQAGMDFDTALDQSVRRALANDGLARGVHECVKCLEKRTAHLCLLADDCEESGIVALVEALCTQNKIRLHKVWSRARANSGGAFAGVEWNWRGEDVWGAVTPMCPPFFFCCVELMRTPL